MKTGSIREAFEPQSDARLESFIRQTPIVAESFNIDDSLEPPPQMSSFGNAVFNDCVIAARANHTLRLAYHAGQTITTQECVDQYKTEVRLENGGLFRDKFGLKLSQSLERWRDQGWTAAARTNRKIGTFLPVNYGSEDEIRATLTNRIGIQVAIDIPDYFSKVGQFGPDHPWTDVDAPIAFNHAILLVGYDPEGVTAITWGEYQKIGWEYIKRRCTAAFAVIPTEATFLKADFGCASEN